MALQFAGGRVLLTDLKSWQSFNLNRGNTEKNNQKHIPFSPNKLGKWVTLSAHVSEGNHPRMSERSKWKTHLLLNLNKHLLASWSPSENYVSASVDLKRVFQSNILSNIWQSPGWRSFWTKSRVKIIEIPKCNSCSVVKSCLHKLTITATWFMPSPVNQSVFACHSKRKCRKITKTHFEIFSRSHNPV